MWERRYVDKDGWTVEESGPSWYDYILEFPTAVRYGWVILGSLILLVPIVIPCIWIRDMFKKR